FWFVVILVEIVFAGAASAVFDHSVKEISTEGADIGNLCVEVTKLDPLGLASAPMLPGDGAPAAKEAAAYRRLVPYAPVAVRGERRLVAGQLPTRRQEHRVVEQRIERADGEQRRRETSEIGVQRGELRVAPGLGVVRGQDVGQALLHLGPVDDDRAEGRAGA